ncbi:hypothetical protein OC861_005290 [Tilletia horrida]|nr:hypothetical protein OC861_005290 [Tilletia horrida]
MSTNKNPGNFANRPREEVVAAGIAGGHNDGAGSAAKHTKEAHDKVVAEGEDPHAPAGGHGDSSATTNVPADEEPDLVQEDEDEGTYEDADDGGGAGGDDDDKPKRGFAAMPKEKVREIASKGGHASHGGHGSKG